MTQDGIRFIQNFYDVITIAAPHTYISALPLAAPDTLLYKAYIGELVAERPWVVSKAMTCSCILRGHENEVNSVAFAVDGSKIVSGSDDRTLRLWDAVQWIHLREPIRHESAVVATEFSSDGSRLTSVSSDGIARQWDVRQATALAHHFDALGVAYSPNSSQIVSISSDAKIRSWDANTGKAIRELTGHWGAVLCVAFSPDGKQIASGSLDGTVRIWDVETGLAREIIDTNRQECKSVAWSPNGSVLATLLHFSPLISLWDVQRRQTILTISTHHPALDIAFSPHGATLASASEDGTIQLWDVSAPAAGKGEFKLDPATHVLRGHTGRVSSIAFSGDGRQLVSGSADKTVRIWTENLILTPCPKPSSVDNASHSRYTGTTSGSLH